VLIAQADGREIDRVVGYGSEPERFRQQLEQAYQGDFTYLKISQAYEADSTNLETIARLAYKCEQRDDYAGMSRLAEKLMQDSEKAKITRVPLGSNQEVTAYEYGCYAQILSHPRKLLTFREEFPQSPLRGNVLYMLDAAARNPKKKREALEVYSELLKPEPKSRSIARRYILLCADLDTCAEAALEHLNAFWPNGPGDDFQLQEAQVSLLLVQGDEAEALEIYGPAYAQAWADSGNAYALNAYAWFWALKGRNLGDAENASRKALELDDNHMIWDTLSMVLWKQKRYAEAIEAEVKALQLAGGKNADYEQRIADIRAEREGK